MKPVETRELRFAYEDHEILKNISLGLKESKITAVIGKSGSGKSTFLKLVAGIMPQGFSGKIRVFGLPRFFRKNRMGFVPQEQAFIPDLSLEDNIKIHGLNLGLSEKNAMERGRSLLADLKMEEDLHKFPRGLSGGQRVRLNIALSLLHDPEIIILDEPFVGLDFGNRKLLWHFLESQKRRGRSILVTSHLLAETQEHADRLVILREGKVFFDGNLEQLQSKLKIYFVYEAKFSALSLEQFSKIQGYCKTYDIPILDTYQKESMFGLKTESQKENLGRLFSKLGLKATTLGFREPNLDEIFLYT